MIGVPELFVAHDFGRRTRSEPVPREHAKVVVRLVDQATGYEQKRTLRAHDEREQPRNQSLAEADARRREEPAAVESLGATPSIRSANGGLDANWMVRHGVPTVTFGAGQNEPHTINEWINLDEYDRACALAVQLATMR